MLRFWPLIPSLWLSLGCGADSTPSSSTGQPRTRTQLLSYTWKVSAGLIDSIAYPVTPAGLGDLRLGFTADSYSFTFPAGCGQAAGTISSTWQFAAGETQVVLDRSPVGAPAWTWEILELDIGHLKTRYQAPAPPDCNPDHTFVLTWIVE